MNAPPEAVLHGTGDEQLVPSEGCRQVSMGVLAREFSDPAYFAVHRLTVAAYTLQPYPSQGVVRLRLAARHPDSVKLHSLAIHLVALCLSLEGSGPQHLLEAPMLRAAAWLRDQPPGRLQRPEQRGALTVADVVGAESAQEHCRRVRDWAVEVWAPWQPHHDRVHSWVAAVD